MFAWNFKYFSHHNIHGMTQPVMPNNSITFYKNIFRISLFDSLFNTHLCEQYNYTHHRPQPLWHYFLTFVEKKYSFICAFILFSHFQWKTYSKYFPLWESSRLSNDRFHNYVNRTPIFYQIHSMDNEIREMKNMILKYEFKRATFCNQILYMTFSHKLQYQL